MKSDISKGLEVMYLIETLTRRPLFQQSISGITIDSVLFGGLHLFTILIILLYRRPDEPAAIKQRHNKEKKTFSCLKIDQCGFYLFL